MSDEKTGAPEKSAAEAKPTSEATKTQDLTGARDEGFGTRAANASIQHFRTGLIP